MRGDAQEKPAEIFAPSRRFCRLAIDSFADFRIPSGAYRQLRYSIFDRALPRHTDGPGAGVGLALDFLPRSRIMDR